MAFTGYPTTALKFFTKLKKNNKREWFLAHKPQYEALLVEPSRHLVYDLNASRALKKLNLKCTEKYPLFRINRDLRFTTDKAPYKTHNGVLFSPSGTRKESGFLYVHLEPGGCMVALGFWHPDPKLLTGFRLWVAENPVAAKTLVKKLK